MPQARAFMRSVQHTLNNLQIEAAAPTAEWTAAIKTALCDLGRTFQYWVYARADEVPEANRDGSEWLYDVTWLDYSGDDLINVPLVAECEWQGGLHIDDDFQKLLLSHADSSPHDIRRKPPARVASDRRKPRQTSRRLHLHPGRRLLAFRRMGSLR